MEQQKEQRFAQKVRKHHTQHEWETKFRNEGRRCHYCEKSLLLETATRDHLTPTCRGGADLIENIVPACLPCNQMKAWRTEEEFKKALPEILTKWRRSPGGIPYKSPCMGFEERNREPGLLKTLRSERERVSWSWKHPA